MCIGPPDRHLEPVAIICFIGRGEVSVGRIAAAVQFVGLENGKPHQEVVVLVSATSQGEEGVGSGGIGKDPLSQSPRSGFVLALGANPNLAEKPPKVVAGFAGAIRRNVSGKAAGTEVPRLQAIRAVHPAV